MATNSPKTNVQLGEFPYPITGKEQESRYLVWLRNHSNYMAVRGFLDYARLVGVLLRGIFINSLIFIPILAVIATIVAGTNLFLPRFDITHIALLVALLSVLAFPLFTPLFKIIRFRKRVATGTDSSVKMRDHFERWFGGVLLLILAAVGFETLSWSLVHFHELRKGGHIGAVEAVSLTSVAAVVFSVAGKIVQMAPGLVKKLAMLLIGGLGVLLPLTAIMFIAEFLVYTPPTLEWVDWVYAELGILFGLIFLALLFGVFFGFNLKDFFKTLAMLVAIGLASALILSGDDTAISEKDRFDTELHGALDQLSTLLVLSEDGQSLQWSGAWPEDDQDPLKDPDEKMSPNAIEADVHLLVSDVAKMRNNPDHDSSKVAKLVGFIEFETTLQLIDDYLNKHEREIWWFDAQVEATEEMAVLAEFAKTARLEDLAGWLHEVGPNRSKLDAQAHDELENLVRRVEVFPTDLLNDISDAAFVKALMDAPLVNIETLHNRPLVCNDQGWCEKDFGDSPVYEVLEKIAPLEPTRTALDEMGDHLFEARTELAIMAAYSKGRYPEIFDLTESEEAHRTGFVIKSLLLVMLVGMLWWIIWITVDVNLTSIHGMYRDRLASAFLVGADTKGDIDIEKDLDLAEICCHEAGSSAPYHLINTALNLQGSTDIGIRDRQSDFFMFSKRFIGGKRTGYCRSESMETVFPQMGLSSAMAISAAAASPNMGRSTSPALVAIMTLLNIRLGYWVPNPGRLEHWLWTRNKQHGKEGGYRFSEVFEQETVDIQRRWNQLPGGHDRKLSGDHEGVPAVEHGLVGIGYSGGGIRSATINLGLTQALQHRGVFEHFDYMSTVSGGGYLGSSFSALMRRKTRVLSEIQGQVSVSELEDGRKSVKVTGGGLLPWSSASGEEREYVYEPFANLAVEDGQRIPKGKRLITAGRPPQGKLNSLGSIYRWRIRPSALLREVRSALDEESRWVNVSDGGHIENLAGIELLRRRCKYIIIGDGEADPLHHFNGFATLMRTARIDLGVEIDIDLDALRLVEDQNSRAHWAVGRIRYPEPGAPAGYLLYFKSSLTGDEDEVIQEYHHAHPTFPHESTADQFFGEGQFEAYRSLGQHIGEHALALAPGQDGKMSYAELENWFKTLYRQHSTSKANDR